MTHVILISKQQVVTELALGTSQINIWQPPKGPLIWHSETTVSAVHLHLRLMIQKRKFSESFKRRGSLILSCLTCPMQSLELSKRVNASHNKTKAGYLKAALLIKKGGEKGGKGNETLASTDKRAKGTWCWMLGMRSGSGRSHSSGPTGTRRTQTSRWQWNHNYTKHHVINSQKLSG